MSDADLDSLYPFLARSRPDAQQLDARLVESIRSKANESITVKQRFFASSAEGVLGAARALADSYRRGGQLLVMGNGGSSCDASHVAVEFLHPVTAGRQALPAVDLSAHPAMLTAVANDVGIEHVFVRQVLALGRAGDVLLGLSTSGNSENLLAAFVAAKARGLATIGLAGGNGGRMRTDPALDHVLVVESTSIHRVQECHVAIYHVLWDIVHTLLASDRSAPARTG